MKFKAVMCHFSVHRCIDTCVYTYVLLYRLLMLEIPFFILFLHIVSGKWNEVDYVL